jgi:hypothetical protein
MDIVPTARHNGVSETHQNNLLGNCTALDEKVGYKWTKTPSGLFVDGHEQVDVVEY